MTLKIHTVLTAEEYQAKNEEGIAQGYYRDDPRVITPGTIWFQPWYFDPTGARGRAGKNVMFPKQEIDRTGFLSQFYWTDWSRKRAPLCIMCPNGEMWEPDRVSSNGPGWQVTHGADLMDITCSPSIVVNGYHGWLKNGEFSDDIEGRGPTGTTRTLTMRSTT